MDIEDLKKKTLEGIEECQEKILKFQKLKKESKPKKTKDFFNNQLHYWKGYQDCLKALDLHFKMEDIKKWANRECENDI